MFEKINQLLGTIKWFVHFWVPGKFSNIDEHGNFEERKCTILQMVREVTCIMNVPSSDCTLIAVRSDWLKLFVCSELEAVHDCYMVQISKTLKVTSPIGPDVHLNENESEDYVEESDILGSFSADDSPNKPVKRSLRNVFMKSMSFCITNNTMPSLLIRTGSWSD